MINRSSNNASYSLLLKNFNDRECEAFGEVYSVLYDELFHFTAKIFKGTEIVASDVIHDIFINIWKTESLKFGDLNNIKAYIYVSIKNNFKSYLAHKKHIDIHHSKVSSDQDYFVTEIIESEIYSLVNQAIDLLPEDCADVLKLHLDGWDINEIAEKIGKSPRTVYNKKYDSIDILRKKMNSGQLYLLINIFLK